MKKKYIRTIKPLAAKTIKGLNKIIQKVIHFNRYAILMLRNFYREKNAWDTIFQMKHCCIWFNGKNVRALHLWPVFDSQQGNFFTRLDFALLKQLEI